MKFACPRGLCSKAIILQIFAELGLTVLKKINPTCVKVNGGRPVQKGGKGKTVLNLRGSGWGQVSQRGRGTFSHNYRCVCPIVTAASLS